MKNLEYPDWWNEEFSPFAGATIIVCKDGFMVYRGKQAEFIPCEVSDPAQIYLPPPAETL